MASKGLRLMANNAVGFLALFVALGGVGYAATGGFSSGGKLQACVNAEGGLKLLPSGKKCKKGQRTVTWNQTGATGAGGATGPAGTGGASGATGAQGVVGERGANGEGADISWAAVGEQGTLESGQGVMNSELRVPGNYLVTFDHDVSECAVVATSNVNSSVRIVSSILRSPEGNAAQVVVATLNLQTKEIESTPFSVVADC